MRAVDDVSLRHRAGRNAGSGRRIRFRQEHPRPPHSAADRADFGQYYLQGKDLLAASSSEMRRLRRDMQIIFQDPFGSLDPRMRVEE